MYGVGESTTMALIAERWGLIPELRSFAKEGRPIWGTCAGLIFLADRASGVLCRLAADACMNSAQSCKHGEAHLVTATHKQDPCTHTGQKEGGQALLGGLDCSVHRNFFGAQINSFETQLPSPAALPAFSSGPQVAPPKALHWEVYWQHAA